MNVDEAEVVKELFALASEIGPQRDLFARVHESASEEFAKDRLPDKEAVSSILRHSIYIGVAEWKIESEYDEEPKKATHERDDWKIISEQLFDEVQEILRERNAKYGYGDEVSDGTEETTPDLSLRDFARIAGWERLATFDDVVRVHCPNCGEEMSDNGHWQATTDLYPSDMDNVPENPLIKRYKCKNKNCLREKRFPNEFEAYRIFDQEIPLSELVEQT